MKKLSNMHIKKSIEVVTGVLLVAMFIFIGLVLHTAISLIIDFEQRKMFAVWNIVLILIPLRYYWESSIRKIQRSRNNKKQNIVLFLLTLATYFSTRIIALLFFYISSFMLISKYPESGIYTIVALTIFDIITWEVIKRRDNLQNVSTLGKMIYLSVTEIKYIAGFSFGVYIIFGFIY